MPVSHTNEKHSPSAWKFSNAIPSWSWNGLDGKPAKVEVYSRALIVELYINGKKVGKKKFKNNCRFDFKVKYESGEIIAINRDKDGKELSRNRLKTAGNETVLSIIPEKTKVKNGEVCFVRLRYAEKEGTSRRWWYYPTKNTIYSFIYSFYVLYIDFYLSTDLVLSTVCPRF